MNWMSRNVVLGVVCLVLAVPTALQLSSEADSFVDLARVPLMFDGFTSDNVGTVLVAIPLAQQPPPAGNKGQPQQVAYEQMLLEWSDEGWRIGQVEGQAPGDLVGAPVLKQRIESDVFMHLRMIRNDPATLVQSNATEEQLQRYGLDVEHALVLKVGDKAGKTVVAELLVGDDSGIGQLGSEAVRGTFVRQAGSNNVVLYEWQKPWRRDVETMTWVDPVLMRPEPDKIRRLAIRNAASKGRTMVFEREPGRAMWRAVAGADGLGAVRQTEVEGLVQRLRYLAVQRFVRPIRRAGNMQELGLFPPQIAIAFSVEKDGERTDVEIEVGGRVAGRNEFYLTCTKQPFLMTWPSASVLPFELDCTQRLFDPK